MEKERERERELGGISTKRLRLVSFFNVNRRPDLFFFPLFFRLRSCNLLFILFFVFVLLSITMKSLCSIDRFRLNPLYPPLVLRITS